MVVILDINEITKDLDEKRLNELAERVFFKSIEILGGLKKLAEYRTLTWLPSLARAVFVILLKDEYLKTEEEIAEYVGLTRQTVRNILRADEEQALYKVQHFEDLSEEEKKELKVHTAGGIAKYAYRKIKEGEEAKTVMAFAHEITEKAMQDCPVPWAYLVLKHTRGIDFPIKNADILLERLKDAPIKEFKVEEVIPEIEYPIKNPAELLKKIKEKLGK